MYLLPGQLLKAKSSLHGSTERVGGSFEAGAEEAGSWPGLPGPGTETGDESRNGVCEGVREVGSELSP